MSPVQLILGCLWLGAIDGIYGQNKIAITTILDPPFMMRKEDGTYEGFVKDVVDLVAKSAGFQYDLNVVADGRYGANDGKGNWSGMVGELIRNEADMSAAPLTVNVQRRAVIGFSRAFLSSGLTIMMNRDDVFGEDLSDYNLGYFLNPFSAGVWILILVCFVVVSVLITLLNRFDPYEYGARAEEGNMPLGFYGHLGFRESLLFCFSGLTLQGYQRPPLSLAVRVMACFWWFFSIIVVATYVANLTQVTQTANTARNPQVTKLSDIMESGVNMGCVDGGSTCEMFRNAKSGSFHEAWVKMDSDASNFPATIAEGLDKIMQGNYAMVAEFPYVDYLVSRNCSIAMVGPVITSASYAFGFRKGSELKAKVDAPLLKLARDGTLTRLHHKWWHTETKCARSKVTEDMVDPKLTSGLGPAVPLTAVQFVGPILVLVIGFFLSIIVFILEVLYYSMSTTTSSRPSQRQQTKA